MNQFPEWLKHKYTEWRGDTIGRSGTVSAYARWLGVSQPAMSEWMTGNRTPESPKSINALVSKYGMEVYEILRIDGKAK